MVFLFYIRGEYHLIFFYFFPSDYRDAFKFFDRDKKGYITAEDFDKALRRMGNTIPTEEEVQNLLKEYDINGRLCYYFNVHQLLERKKTTTHLFIYSYYETNCIEKAIRKTL